MACPEVLGHSEDVVGFPANSFTADNAVPGAPDHAAHSVGARLVWMRGSADNGRHQIAVERTHDTAAIDRVDIAHLFPAIGAYGRIFQCFPSVGPRVSEYR